MGGIHVNDGNGWAVGWVWVGDITHIHTGVGWLYLATVLDVGSRKVIGCSMAADMSARLVVDALHTATATRGHRTAGVIFHSDRGSQYLSGSQCLSGSFASALALHQIRHSVGRVANCWDNSVAESLFSSLKRELVSQTRFETRDQARREIFAWTGRYNNRRIHSTLNHQTPTEWETTNNNGYTKPRKPSVKQTGGSPQPLTGLEA